MTKQELWKWLLFSAWINGCLVVVLGSIAYIRHGELNEKTND